MNFKEKVFSLFGQYNYDLNVITYESTERIFFLRKSPNNEFAPIPLSKLTIGHFYLILYDYNGNKIFCPILPIEYRVHKNKNILYAVNLDYLPYEYKMEFFGEMMRLYQPTLEKNEDINDVKSEFQLKGIKFENIYKTLKKNGGYEYSVTAFDILKIKEVNKVSTNILDRFLFLNTRMVNSALMKDLIENSDVDEFKKKLQEIVNEYDSIKMSLEEDTKAFYKRLRTFERNYKLIE